MTQTQVQVTVKVILPEMVCRNCKRFYIALQDARAVAEKRRGDAYNSCHYPPDETG